MGLENDKKLSDFDLEEKPRIEFIDPIKQRQKERERAKAILHVNSGMILSLVVAVLYLFLGVFSGGGEGFFKTILFLLLPLALIWFPDEMGGHTGSSWGLGGSMIRRIDTFTPGAILKFMGWVLLFTPLIIGFFSALFPG